MKEVFSEVIVPILLGLLLTLCLALSLFAQEQPDSHGEVTLAQPSYRGEAANAPVAAKFHVRNEGGSDGAGLCVISSVLSNGMQQGVPGLDVSGPGTSNKPDQFGRVPDAPGKGSELWRKAKSRPGGYWPTKLTRLIDEIYGPPGQAPESARYASILDKDPKVLDTLSRKGYPLAVTMGTGAFYHYAPISHMVSLDHYRIGGLAIIHDNNDPGRWHGMPATEFDRRWIDQTGFGWAFFWTKPPGATSTETLYIDVLGAAVVLIFIRHRRAAAKDLAA